MAVHKLSPERLFARPILGAPAAFALALFAALAPPVAAQINGFDEAAIHVVMTGPGQNSTGECAGRINPATGALALAYGEAHADRCTGFILRGVFLCRRSEISWLIGTYVPVLWQYSSRARAASITAVAWPRPMPFCSRVMQIEPPPMPTFTKSAPASAR